MVNNILITGANGQLGSELKELLSTYDYKIFYTDREELDITSEEEVDAFVSSREINFIVNCAAYTAVDKAETDQTLCYAINETGAKNLALATEKYGAFMIHVSTDFVFDGSLARPLVEDDLVNPLSVYGASKLAAERIIEAETRRFIVLRTSWLYSSFGANFVKTILRLCKEKESLNMIFDQIGTPTYAGDLATVIVGLMTREDLENLAGLYHYSNEGVASWFDFAIAIRDIAKLKTPIYPIETHQYPTPATRPKFSVLNKKKIKDSFGIKIPYWRESLEICLKKINEQHV